MPAQAKGVARAGTKRRAGAEESKKPSAPAAPGLRDKIREEAERALDYHTERGRRIEKRIETVSNGVLNGRRKDPKAAKELLDVLVKVADYHEKRRKEAIRELGVAKEGVAQSGGGHEASAAEKRRRDMEALRAARRGGSPKPRKKKKGKGSA